MVLEHYISELLYRYDCVVVPSFGAFLSQHTSAVINEQSNSFYPPTKTLSFNSLLSTNDGLLANHIAQIEGLPYEQAIQTIESTVLSWKDTLNKEGQLSLTNIGALSINSSNKIQFKPQNQVNYLTSSFGLSSFVTPPVTREELKIVAEEVEEKVPLLFTPEQRKATNFRPLLKYAAIVLLAFSAGFTGYRHYTSRNSNEQIVVEKAKNEVTKNIQEATFFSTAPLELPTLNLDAITEVPKKDIHHIVAGAFRFKENAERKINQLKQLGFEAAYFGTNDHGLHMVTYSSHAEVDEALQNLRHIKSSHSKDAWLLSIR